MSVEEQDSLEPAITAVGHHIFLLLRSLSWRSTKFHPKGGKVMLYEGYYTATKNLSQHLTNQTLNVFHERLICRHA